MKPSSALPGARKAKAGQGVAALEKFFARDLQSGYRQSHPLSHMETVPLLMDEITRNNNAMRLIFGGQPGAQDSIHHAYKQAARQMAEAPVEKDSLLQNMNPADFVPAGMCSKDSLLETFAEARQYYKGALEDDATRALKARATHRIHATMYNGKNQGTRWNPVYGYNNFVPEVPRGFSPFGSLSSRPNAPDGTGGRVPFNVEAAMAKDPRSIQSGRDLGRAIFRSRDAPLPDFSVKQRDAPLPDLENEGFAAQFRSVKPRA
jgi:hypothetical protein